MSNASTVLARKYRPRNFHELVGQTHVSQALINAIDHNRLHHAYLFTGTRGVGKTTIARILAKCLNCDQGITSKPCGSCNNCTMIDDGRFIDLIEIDAASRTKVEDTRDLLDNVPYAPTQGRYKVYLIDEVHMLSTHSFNALLKTLEEPPSHVKFLLATTDPQKLPITIISRCLQFVLRPLSQQLLSDHLNNILTQENIQFEQGALWQLAHSAKGSVRDSLSLTDQAIAFSHGTLTESSINDMLGLISSGNISDLLMSLYNNDKISVAKHIEQMRQQMVDANHIFDELAQLLHKIALWQILPTIDLNVNSTQAQAIAQLGQQISAESLQLYYEIVLKSRENLALATTPMQALEMCILRMLAFRPLANDEYVVHDIQQIGTVQDNNDQPTSQETVKADSEIQEVQIENQTQPQDPLTIDEEECSLQQDIEEAINKAFSDEPSEEQIAEVTKQVNEQPTSEPPQTTIIENTTQTEQKIEQDNNTQDNNTIEPPIIATDIVQTLEETVSPTPTADPNLNGLMDVLFVNDDEDYYEDELYDDYQEYDPQAITNSELLPTNQEITPSQTTQTEINQPIVQSQSATIANVNKTIIDFDGDDPRVLLKCEPQQLTDQWTVEKWDYWVQTAREQGVLDKDELAFARQGIMTGDCDGQSVFYTSIDSDSFTSIFTNISQQLSLEFTHAQYRLEKCTTADQLQDIPQNRQLQREELAKQQAIELLNQSPVIKKLQQYSPITIQSVKLMDC